MIPPFKYHWLPLAALELSVTLPPAQNVVGPAGVIVGVAGGTQVGQAPGPGVSSMRPVTPPEKDVQVVFGSAVLKTRMKSFCAATVKEYEVSVMAVPRPPMPLSPR